MRNEEDLDQSHGGRMQLGTWGGAWCKQISAKWVGLSWVEDRSQGLKIRAQHIVGPSYADLTTVPPKMTLRNLYQTTLSKLREFASVWGQKFVRSYMLIPEASLFLFITRIL